MINIYNKDCLEAMKLMKDNQFDLAIVDTPYGIKRFGNRVELSNRLCKSAKINEWDTKPTPVYFAELFRVSKNQIIWGANNFTLPQSEYFLVWDKHQTVDNFASAEYAWTNCKKPAKVFRYSIHKTMSDRKSEGGKIHPTQKPVKLYEWLLMNYAKEGDKILDTHLGSGSIAIACHNLGYDLEGYELDKEYYDNALKRIKNHQAQLRII
jgi:site-specific DNA-methyltransferase (adenine-specific)